MDYRNIRLVALDLDDTTLMPGHLLSENTRKAIEALIQCGVEVVIASGRPFSSLPENVLQIPGLHYAITSNGAAIHQIPDGQRLHGFTLSPATVKSILETADQAPVLLETFIDGVAYADSRYVRDPVKFGAGTNSISYVQRTRKPVDDMRKFILENCDRLDSIDLICPDLDRKPEYQKKIAAAAPDTYITTSCRQLLEISDIRSGKASALQTICQRHGWTAEYCAAFGNAENDVDMLEFAALGVAVANATPDCLAAADLICKSNEEEGVAEILWEMVKRKRGC